MMSGLLFQLYNYIKWPCGFIVDIPVSKKELMRSGNLSLVYVFAWILSSGWEELSRITPNTTSWSLFSLSILLIWGRSWAETFNVCKATGFFDEHLIWEHKDKYSRISMANNQVAYDNTQRFTLPWSTVTLICHERQLSKRALVAVLCPNT